MQKKWFVLACVFASVGAVVVLFVWLRSEKQIYSETYTTRTKPSVSLDETSVSLDLNRALVFVLKDGRLGFLYFTGIRSNDATYFMLMNDGNENMPDEKNGLHGTLSMRSFSFLKAKKMPCVQLDEKCLFYWTPPANLFFTERIIRSAIVDKQILQKGRNDFTNELSWVVVKISPL